MLQIFFKLKREGGIVYLCCTTFQSRGVLEDPNHNYSVIRTPHSTLPRPGAPPHPLISQSEGALRVDGCVWCSWEIGLTRHCWKGAYFTVVGISLSDNRMCSCHYKLWGIAFMTVWEPGRRAVVVCIWSCPSWPSVSAEFSWLLYQCYSSHIWLVYCCISHSATGTEDGIVVEASKVTINIIIYLLFFLVGWKF